MKPAERERIRMISHRGRFGYEIQSNSTVGHARTAIA